MLREEVLKEWANFKQVINKQNQVFNFVIDKLSGRGVFPNYIVFNSNNIEAKLEEWNSSQYQEKIQAEKNEITDKCLSFENNEAAISLQLAHYNSVEIFLRLVRELWKSKNCFRDIEEVD